MKNSDYTIHPYSLYRNCWQQAISLTCHPGMQYFSERNDVVELFLTWMTKFKVRRNQEIVVEDTITAIVAGIRNILAEFSPLIICEILMVITKRPNDYKPVFISQTLSWCRKNFIEACKIWDSLILDLPRPYCTNTSDRFEVRNFLQWFTMQCLVNNSDSNGTKWKENTDILEEFIQIYSGPIKHYIECFTFRKILLAISRMPVITNMNLRTKTVYYVTNVVMTRLHDLRELWMSRVSIPRLDCNQASISFCIQSYLISDLLSREPKKHNDVSLSVQELIEVVNNLSESGMRDSAISHILQRVIRVLKRYDDMFAFRERLITQLHDISNMWTELGIKWNSEVKFPSMRMGKSCDINVHNFFMDMIELLLNVRGDIGLALEICDRLTTTITVNLFNEFMALGLVCRVVSKCRSLDESYLMDLDRTLGLIQTNPIVK